MPLSSQSSQKRLSQRHVVIVGAGVIGMLSALEFQRRGWRVSVFDRVNAGTEASWAGGGILSPILPWDYPPAVWRLSRRSLALYGALAAQLIEHTGVDPELTASGALALDPQVQERGRAWCASAGLPAETVGVSLQAVLPERAALLLPWIGQIRNPRLCRALALRLRQLGVTIHEHTPVRAWLRDGERVVGVRSAAGEHRADCVVLAAGAWSGTLQALPVAPVRGQMLLLRLAPERLQRIVFAGGRYLIPRRDGRVLVGSTVEHAGFDKRTSEAARQELLGFATSLLGDDVAACVEAHWCGLRPGSDDGVPLIGEHPQRPGLWLNTGHYRNGLVMAPASAELLVDSVEGQVTQVDAEYYRPTQARLGIA